MSLSQGPPRPPAPGIPRNILEARARTTVLSQRQRPPRRAVSSPPPPPADARRADVVAGRAQGSQPRDTEHRRTQDWWTPITQAPTATGEEASRHSQHAGLNTRV
ncbi:hypothetical protein HPB50_001824 [Hyalomma asiaticum]|uniref:Uncharacterized protein n=1 Tax=Hyalomma asiaticum TaxID=266040 RepID=A0ACB7SJ58_HYAAI|nr:hypothetical protein HPB50_001824 [Hyalomma asiaticum]